MATDGKEFQKNRLPWSRWKHEILIRYLKTMSAILSNARQIYYIDGFAGPGRYVEDGVDGSPLLAAKHAQMLLDNNDTYSLHCINVENDEDVFVNLQNSTEEFSSLITNFKGKFVDYVTEILDLIGEQPALFFLDPIGLKGIEWNELLSIFERDSTTEILLRFDAQTAIRLTGSDTKYHKTFNLIIGEESSEYWLPYYDNCGQSGQEKRDCITQAYVDKLRIYFPYIARIPIKQEDELFKYYLLFATRNLKGIQAMNDILYGINDLRDKTLDHERRIRNELKQMDMFEPQPEDKLLDELNDLKSILLEYMDNDRVYRRDNLRAEVALIGSNFGRFTGAHYTAVLGGNSRKIKVPKEFKSLNVDVVNYATLGNDRAEIKLMD